MDKRLTGFSEFLLFLALILVSLLLAISTSLPLSVLDGLNLFFACVLPSVFPYFFITAILGNLNMTHKVCNKLSPLMNFAFNQNGVVGYAFFMSFIAGYPMGAKIVSELKNNNLITKSQAVRASILCSTSSPMFLISSVGSIMFKSTKFGLLLLACNFLSALVLGIILSFTDKTRANNHKAIFSPIKTENLLNDTVYSCVNSTLFVGGIITLFYVLTEILALLNILAPFTFAFGKLFGNTSLGQGLSFGLFEYTKGLKTISSAPISFFTLPVSSFICGFCGLSVIIQSVAFLKDAKIKIAPFVFGKLVGATINFILGVIFTLVFY